MLKVISFPCTVPGLGTGRHRLRSYSDFLYFDNLNAVQHMVGGHAQHLFLYLRANFLSYKLKTLQCYRCNHMMLLIHSVAWLTFKFIIGNICHISTQLFWIEWEMFLPILWKRKIFCTLPKLHEVHWNFMPCPIYLWYYSHKIIWSLTE